MKRFSFKLDPLLELRRQREENIKLRLAEKNRAIIEKNRELANIYEQIRALQATEKTIRSQNPSALLLRYGTAFRYKLRHDIFSVCCSIDKLQAEASSVQKELIEAKRARRSLELLRDRRCSMWKKAYKRKEQLFIDDVAQQKYIASKRP